jgi:hypothetical protein
MIQTDVNDSRNNSFVKDFGEVTLTGKLVDQKNDFTSLEQTLQEISVHSIGLKENIMKLADADNGSTTINMDATTDI